MSAQSTIALIDDDEIFQFTTLRIVKLTNLPYTVTQFFNGDQALSYLNKNSEDAEKLPDVILLDINMPIVDGWMFLDEFKTLKQKLKKKITIYMVSSSIAPEDVNRAKANPLVSDYLVKPLSVETVKQVLSMN
ncbi:MAG: response regulator [Cyclobacteriaceae bacterium]|nr:response regulator [Cyclobacteriaceae bacterium]UYN86255.1 MAG: response regulator [Cyclobacteriaceae bacterium]